MSRANSEQLRRRRSKRATATVTEGSSPNIIRNINIFSQAGDAGDTEILNVTDETQLGILKLILLELRALTLMTAEANGLRDSPAAYRAAEDRALN